ncbi:MAG: YicC family protein [Candidatus Omnitrophica bacterium]|nr:YicC family protein [Candidatus Omnitrophota bacterium]
MSIQSMTGYSRLTKRLPRGSVTVELRSTNHRFLELNQRLPDGLLGFEAQVADVIRAHLRRGRIDVSVTAHLPQATSKRVALDEPLLDAYYARLQSLQRRYGLAGGVTLDQLLALPHVVSVADDQAQRRTLWPQVRQLLQEALRALLATRRAEGARLGRDIRLHARVIRRAAATIRARLPKSAAQYKQRMRDRLTAAAGETLTATQLQEALAVIRDTDIQEELVRLESHLVHLEQTLKTAGFIGKRLDFIAQELTREANTLGAKANDAVIVHAAIDIKSAIEKIREQAQNLE